VQEEKLRLAFVSHSHDKGARYRMKRRKLIEVRMIINCNSKISSIAAGSRQDGD
jgi:hypothetical protein